MLAALRSTISGAALALLMLAMGPGCARHDRADEAGASEPGAQADFAAEVGAAAQAEYSAAPPIALRPQALAERLWAMLVSEDHATVTAGWRALVHADPDLLRRARYEFVDFEVDNNTPIVIGDFSFDFDAAALRRLDAAFTEAFPPGTEADAALACIAFDSLGAGVMIGGPGYTYLFDGLIGMRAFQYDRAILTRIFALQKLDLVDPDSPYDPKARTAGLHEIRKSDKVAEVVP